MGAIHLSPTDNKTLQEAIDQALAENSPLELADGTWFLPETLQIDSTTPLTITAAPGAAPVISGGRRLNNLQWQKMEGGVFCTDIAPEKVEGIDFDQLFVNGRRMDLARYPNRQADAGPSGFKQLATLPFGGVSEDCIAPERIRTWRRPEGAYVHGLHGALWGSQHYWITGVDEKGEAILDGGWQENRGEHGLHPKLRFVENVLEELDAPNEWHYDKEAGRLYFMPPEDLDLEQAEFVAAGLKCLARVRGQVTLCGISFEHTARTFMEPHDKMTRGDWALARVAALFFEGATDCQITDCRFERLGGMGIHFRGYNRSHRVAGCRFTDLGESAVVMVGEETCARSLSVGYFNNVPEAEIDLTPGPQAPDYPGQCVFENNLVHNIGVVNKQSAALFTSIAADIVIRHNTVYNIPRSAFTINDGAFGGHVVEYNHVFDTVRESGDHGPFNSWGRDRHWQTRHAGGEKGDQEQAGLMSRLDNHKTTIIRHNRFEHPPAGNHSWGIDLDDGSSNYHLYNNLCLGCSFKLREGFYRLVENNICIGRFPPGKHVCYKNNHDVIRRNIYVNTGSPIVYEGIGCLPDEVDQLDYNLYWSLTGDAIVCLRGDGGRDMPTFAEWQGRGYDRHSLVADPLFVDPEANDFTLRHDSPAFQLGFQPFDVSTAGVWKEVFRQESRSAHPDARYYTALEEKKSGRPDAACQLYDMQVKNLVGMQEMSAAAVGDETGVLVTGTEKGGSAEEAGLKPRDLILKWNDHVIDTVEDLKVRLQEDAGKEATLCLDGNKPPRQITFTV